MYQLLEKPEKAKLLPGRRHIIQITERPSLQNLSIKTRSKVPVPENSIITKGSGHHDKVISVSDYTISQIMSECDSISIII